MSNRIRPWKVFLGSVAFAGVRIVAESLLPATQAGAVALEVVTGLSAYAFLSWLGRRWGPFWVAVGLPLGLGAIKYLRLHGLTWSLSAAGHHVTGTIVGVLFVVGTVVVVALAVRDLWRWWGKTPSLPERFQAATAAPGKTRLGVHDCV
jgi:hypothetical protein